MKTLKELAQCIIILIGLVVFVCAAGWLMGAVFHFIAPDYYNHYVRDE